MCRINYFLVLLSFLCFLRDVYGSVNVTFEDVPLETLVNLTGNNELWNVLLKDCQEPTLACVQNNIYKYLRDTLDKTDDLQFTSFLKFTKNTLDYAKIKRSFDTDSNSTDDIDHDEDESPIESISRSLHENTANFLMTHDVELSLPDGLFPNSFLKISPKAFQDHGTLVNLEVVSKDLPEDTGLKEGGRTIKKIRKFITEKLIYAILAILLIIKLLAVKFLFLLPLIVGAATAKKLLLKILLFVFPFLHHIFKFCAYYPIQAKYHHHKHLISHIHEVAPPKYHDHHEDHHDHHEGVELDHPPYDYHGPDDGHHSEYADEVNVLPDDGSGFPHGRHWLVQAKFLAVKFGTFVFFTGRKIVHFLIGNPWLVDKLKDVIKKVFPSTVYFIIRIAQMAIRTPWIRDLGKQFTKKILYWAIIYLPRLLKTSAFKLISHRKDPTRADNEVFPYGNISKRKKPGRPLTSIEIERMVAKAEKEAIIKARLEKERLRIREENLKLQEQLNQAIKLQEKLKQQAVFINKKLPPTKISASVPYANKPVGIGPHANLPKGLQIDPNNLPRPTIVDAAPGIELPPGYLPQHVVPQQSPINNAFQASRYDQQYQPSQVNVQHEPVHSNFNHGPIYKPSITNSQSVAQEVNRRQPVTLEYDFQQSIEYDPRNPVYTENSKEVQYKKDIGYAEESFVKESKQPEVIEKPTPIPKEKLEQEIYKAALITHDPFYSPILEKIDKILQGPGLTDEFCKERLICSMYKNPEKFSPHSNLLSIELSRDSSELQKPTTTNTAVIRFYKYVQAARDGQDQRDCLRLYPGCAINTEVS